MNKIQYYTPFPLSVGGGLGKTLTIMWQTILEGPPQPLTHKHTHTHTHTNNNMVFVSLMIYFQQVKLRAMQKIDERWSCDRSVIRMWLSCDCQLPSESQVSMDNVWWKCSDQLKLFTGIEVHTSHWVCVFSLQVVIQRERERERGGGRGRRERLKPNDIASTTNTRNPTYKKSWHVSIFLRRLKRRRSIYTAVWRVKKEHTIYMAKENYMLYCT